MSEQYLVSARKYRPQTFDTVVGQQHITTTLKNAIKNNHLAHAYLFCGPRGVGKTTCARILAKTINCENPTPDMEACGSCDSCNNFSENSGYNVFELDAASNNSVDDIRNLTEQVRYAPQAGKYKVYIIDEVHMLSTAAFNAFLKTLEEPPGYAIFILATTEKHKILPTVLSRCQIFDFKRISTHDIVHHLKTICTNESTNFEENALHIIARKSEGCMRDALSIMDRISSFSEGQLTYSHTLEHLNMLDEELYFKITEYLMNQSYNEVLLLLNDLFQKGFEGNTILSGLQEHFRNLLLSKDANMAKLLDIPDAYKQQYFQSAQNITEGFLLTSMRIINDTEISYNLAPNKRMHTELCMIKLANIQNALNLSTLLQSDEIKKKISHLSNKSKSTQEKAEKPESKPENITVHKEPVTPKEAVNTTQLKCTDETQVKSNRKSGNKFGRHLVDDLIRENSEVNQNEKSSQIHTLNDDLIAQLIDEYLSKMQENGSSFYKTQLENVTCKLVGESTIECVSQNLLQLNTLNNIKGELVNFFVKKTGNSNIKWVNNLDKSQENSPKDLIPTKHEFFEQMAQKYPIIQTLKTELNLKLTGYNLLEKDMNHTPVIEKLPSTENISIDSDDLDILDEEYEETID